MQVRVGSAFIIPSKLSEKNCINKGKEIVRDRGVTSVTVQRITLTINSISDFLLGVCIQIYLI